MTKTQPAGDSSSKQCFLWSVVTQALNSRSILATKTGKFPQREEIVSSANYALRHGVKVWKMLQ